MLSKLCLFMPMTCSDHCSGTRPSSWSLSSLVSQSLPIDRLATDRQDRLMYLRRPRLRSYTRWLTRLSLLRPAFGQRFDSKSAIATKD